MDAFIIVLLGAVAVLATRGGQSPAPAPKKGSAPRSLASAAAKAITQIVYVHDAASPTKAPVTAPPPNALNALGASLAPQIAPAASEEASRTAGAVLSSAGERASFFTAGGPAKGVGEGLTAAGELVGSSTIPLAGTFAVKLLSGFRGASNQQQAAKLGAASLATAETGLSAIPLVGNVLATLLGAGAATYEGKRAVREVGRVEEQGYQVQKELLSGHVSEAFSGGGSTHKARVRAALAKSTAQAKQVQLDVESIKAGAITKTPAGSVGGQDAKSIASATAKNLAESLAVQKTQMAKLMAAHMGGNRALSPEEIAAVQAKNAEAAATFAASAQSVQDFKNNQATQTRSGFKVM